MQKVAVIGAGQVGSQTAFWLLLKKICEVVLIDISGDLAKGKALDLEDLGAGLGIDFNVKGTKDFSKIRDSDICIITAGLTRKPGMSREDLLKENKEIVKRICNKIKKLAPQSIVIVVTNPVDILTYFVFKNLGFSRNRILGMGSSLDTYRLKNLISKRLKVSIDCVESLVIGEHGKCMVPLFSRTYVNLIPIREILNKKDLDSLKEELLDRGKRIVESLGKGSAYLAPGFCCAEIVESILQNLKRTIPVSFYLEGEYRAKNVCIGVPCVISRKGVQNVVEIKIDKEEEQLFLEAVRFLKEYT